MQKTAVVVTAHPDDEAFGPAGTILLLSKTHIVNVICVTNGDADASFTIHKGDLGKVRRRELLESAKILRISTVKFLGYKDGSLCNNIYHDVADKIKKILDNWKPEVVVTFEPRGVSGHLDHVAISLIVSYVFDQSKYIKKLMYYCISNRWRRLIKNYFIFFPPGYEDKEVDEIVDISKVWNAKKAAMRAHVTQKKDAERIILGQSFLPKREYFLVKKR